MQQIALTRPDCAPSRRRVELAPVIFSNSSIVRSVLKCGESLIS